MEISYKDRHNNIGLRVQMAKRHDKCVGHDTLTVLQPLEQCRHDSEELGSLPAKPDCGRMPNSVVLVSERRQQTRYTS